MSSVHLPIMPEEPAKPNPRTQRIASALEIFITFHPKNSTMPVIQFGRNTATGRWAVRSLYGSGLVEDVVCQPNLKAAMTDLTHRLDLNQDYTVDSSSPWL